MERLEILRNELGEIDDQIIQLLNERRKLSKRIGIVKDATNKPYENKEAFELTKKKYNDTLGMFGTSLYLRIHTDSVEIQTEL
jgi:chorismate mutase